MTYIDWNIAVIKTLKKGKFPHADTVKSKLQWIENRLVVSLQGFDGYCGYSRKDMGDQTDIEKIEDSMIEIIDAASFVLKTTRALKSGRIQKSGVTRNLVSEKRSGRCQP